MSTHIEKSDFTGLKVVYYSSDNVYPILPLLSEEFPHWTIDKIKNYVQLVIKKKREFAGMLVAQNESLYNVGLLIYTLQSVSSENLHKNSKEEFTFGLVVENIICSSPIMKEQVFLTIVEAAMDIAKRNNCEFLELPKFDENYKLIEKKYKNQIIKINSFRTAIDLV